MTKPFDAIIVGGGQAGPPLAGRLTGAGMRVALIERKLLGGTCVNTGCIPTKTLVASARAAQVARRAGDLGVTIDGRVGVDMPQVKARADRIVESSRDGIEQALRGNERCTLIMGQARLESRDTIRVADEVLRAPRIFLNVGARANVPPLRGIEGVRYLTNSTMRELDLAPRHLVIVGGSYVGLEFGQMYRRFGSEVTIVEKGPRLIGREDEDTSTMIREILGREGIAVRLDAECIAFSRVEGGTCVHVDCTSGDCTVTGSHVLLAVGRRPNTDDLGLDRAGVQVDRRGFIVVDDELRTNVPGIWALGECNGHGAFTHTAYNDFEIVAGNLLDGDRRRLTDRITAYALYIDPPLGRCGLTETEARRTGRRFLMGTRPMSRVGRAVEKGETQGFMKILVDAESERIAGAAILGTGGDEAIHGILDTMYAGVPYTTLRRSVGIHPTVSELIPTVLGELTPLR